MNKRLALRAAFIVVAGLLVMAVSALTVTFIVRPDLLRGETGTGERVTVGGPFELVDGSGRTVTEDLVAGSPYAIFFGFTYCPDVCPTTLAETSLWIDKLGADADRMKFLFVTVDPERDTPEVMADYVGAFSDKIIGLTGTREQIDNMVKSYRIYARRVELEDGDYTMDHSASMLLFDADGKLQATINYRGDSDDSLEKLQKLIGA